MSKSIPGPFLSETSNKKWVFVWLSRRRSLLDPMHYAVASPCLQAHSCEWVSERPGRLQSKKSVRTELFFCSALWRLGKVRERLNPKAMWQFTATTGRDERVAGNPYSNNTSNKKNTNRNNNLNHKP